MSAMEFLRNPENVGGMAGWKGIDGRWSKRSGIFFNGLDFSWSPENIGVVAGYRWVGRVKERW